MKREVGGPELRLRGKKRELVITRVFDAPRELVWKAWTEPEHMMRWWGPKDFTCSHCEIDLSVGGKYLNCMRGPAGTDFDRDYWSTGIYREIVQLKRIVYTDSFADENGNVVPATHYGMSADFPPGDAGHGDVRGHWRQDPHDPSSRRHPGRRGPRRRSAGLEPVLRQACRIPGEGIGEGER